MKQESEKPPCFNSEREYEQWKALLVRSMEKDVTICDDCTNDYRQKMMAESRCKPEKAVFFPRKREKNDIPMPKMRKI